MAADNNEMVQHALQAYNEQRYDDALLLLKKYKADGTACDTWLRMRLAIKMEQWNHPWLRPPIKIERQNQSWRGALAQSFAEAAFLQAHYDEARKYYRLALRLGGKHMDEASVLRHLIIIHRRKGSVADAEQYARLLWYGRYPQSDRVFGGILYAQLIHAKNPAEARDVVSTIRVMPKLTIDQMVQSHVLLIKLLLPDQTLHAE